jgi:hypothetical protein
MLTFIIARIPYARQIIVCAENCISIMSTCKIIRDVIIRDDILWHNILKNTSLNINYISETLPCLSHHYNYLMKDQIHDCRTEYCKAYNIGNVHKNGRGFYKYCATFNIKLMQYYTWINEDDYSKMGYWFRKYCDQFNIASFERLLKLCLINPFYMKLKPITNPTTMQLRKVKYVYYIYLFKVISNRLYNARIYANFNMLMNIKSIIKTMKALTSQQSSTAIYDQICLFKHYICEIKRIREYKDACNTIKTLYFESTLRPVKSTLVKLRLKTKNIFCDFCKHGYTLDEKKDCNQFIAFGKPTIKSCINNGSDEIGCYMCRHPHGECAIQICDTILNLNGYYDSVLDECCSLGIGKSIRQQKVFCKCEYGWCDGMRKTVSLVGMCDCGCYPDVNKQYTHKEFYSCFENIPDLRVLYDINSNSVLGEYLYIIRHNEIGSSDPKIIPTIDFSSVPIIDTYKSERKYEYERKMQMKKRKYYYNKLAKMKN